MHEEETVHNRALWEAYGDEELLALEDRIKAHHTPEEMTFVLRWMLPAMTPAERAGLVHEPAQGGAAARRRESGRARQGARRRQRVRQALARARRLTDRAMPHFCEAGAFDSAGGARHLDELDRLPHAKAEAAASRLLDRQVLRALGKPARKQDEARLEIVRQVR